MTITFYDLQGKPTAYIDDEVHIYLFSGQPVAYLYNESVYAYSGRHLGWFENGWIRDHQGYCVFFTKDASGGPLKPVKKVKPVKGVKKVKPVKGVKQVKPTRPTKKSSWSDLSGEKFFSRN